MPDQQLGIVMTLLSVLMVLFTGMIRAQPGDLTVTGLKVEYMSNPVGIDEHRPRLSWKLQTRQRNTRQTAYRLQVSETGKFSADGILWDTGRVSSDRSVHLAYRGPDLESGKRYFWRVQTWDNHGNRSGWSDPAFWEMGLLTPGDWAATWIEPGLEQDTTRPQPAPMLRREFQLDGNVRRARAYVTSHGLYEMKINGQNVGNQLFTPGWTSYHNRLQYQTYDVTDLLSSGDNAVGVTLGNGWFRGWIGFSNQRNFYGTRLALLVQIEVTYADGTTELITSDGSWKASTGPIRMSDIYDGEVYDATMEKKGWTNAGYDDSNWTPVRTARHGKVHLAAPDAPPVRKIQELHPVEILTTPEGDTVVDMGQNMVGWIRLRTNGPRNHIITLHHAEVLDKEGNFYTENLRAAEQKVTYILNGGGDEVYEPHFTFQGFRYVKVEGYPGELTKDDLVGVVIHSDMEPTGHFETSSALVNQLQHNIVWGQKGNFLDIPTDCPQRDERLGWTGDIQVFAQTACYNMDAAGFLDKWLQDLEADQREDGAVPYVIPNVLGENAVGASGWGDASVIVPWTLYQAYGDERILQQQYDSMKQWVEFMRERAQADSTTYLWDNNFTFGDWLSFNSDASDYPGAYTDKELISTAFFARSTELLHKTAVILGRNEDAMRYTGLHEAIKDAFQVEYVTMSGRVLSNTQTAYLLALQFDLLPEDFEHAAIRYLLADIRERGHHTTGFLGTPHLNPVLSQYGYDQQAYELLLRTEYPSWLYPVTMGATTIWERWDGIKPDSTFQDPGMNSFNHYAYGAIGEWLYKTVAGIEPAEPGYRTMAIKPTPGGGFTHVRSIKETMFGTTASEWNFTGDRFSMRVEVPVNTTAEVTLPNAAGKEVISGGEELSDGNGINTSEEQNEDLVLDLGSG
ncbi:MAG: glycoside hydrolase family 78 protein, partial [Balneolaceae bacterium]|nr:glycoside hydrolase family 78 protein [Balneolaceae bacterium]